MKVGPLRLSPHALHVYYLFQELIKVRGFQVAPAELEGHLLDHPDVADSCVIGVPDDYSGEVPFAFVALEQRAAARIKENAKEADKTKQSIMKVSILLFFRPDG